MPLCHSHANTWKVNGRPVMEVFVRRFDEVATTEEEIIRLGVLGPQLRLEIQYVLQRRHDKRATKTLPAVVMALVRALAATGAGSLLDQTEDQWRTGIGRPAPRDSNLRALLIDARRTIADLADACGAARDVVVCRELTKRFETVVRGTLGSVGLGTPRGEYVIVLSGRPIDDTPVSDDRIISELRADLADGSSTKDAVAAVADRLGVSKKSVYALAIADR